MSFNPALIPTLPTTAALLAAFASGEAVPPTVLTLGRISQGDGGGGVFYYNSSDTTTSDNGGTIRVDAANRRWYSTIGRQITPLLFGAKGDGTTNDATAVHATAVWLNNSGGGDVLIDRPYCMAATFMVDFVKVNWIDAGGKIISFLPVSGGPYGPLHFSNCSNFRINCHVDGNYPAFAVTPSGAGLNNFCIVLDSDCHDVDIGGAYIHDSGCNNGGDHAGDGVYVNGTGNATHNINIHDNRFHNCARWAVAVLAGSQISITNNDNTHDHDIPALGFVDVEYGSGVPLGFDVSIIGNRSRGPSLISLSTNTNPGILGVAIIGNVLNFSYADNGLICTTGVLSGFGLYQIVDFTLVGNQVENCSNDNYHLENCSRGNITANRNNPGLASTGTTFYALTCDHVNCNNNNFTSPSASDYAMQLASVASFMVRGGTLQSNGNVALLASVTDDHCVFDSITMVGVDGDTFDIGGGSVTFARNNSATSGRLDAHAHTVISNNCYINNISGDWQLQGGYLLDPDLHYGGTSRLVMTNGYFAASVLGSAASFVEGTIVTMRDSAISGGKVLWAQYKLTSGTNNVAGTDWTPLYCTTS